MIDANRINPVNALLAERPSFHGETAAGTQSWGLAADVLYWIQTNVPQGGCTLETGCGYSTVAFASAGGARHTVLSPFAGEHTLIRQWCAGHGMDLGQVAFEATPSQDVIYRLGTEPLDMVLIDGAHEFPIPFIDWYYTADRINANGYLVVDDTQIPTGYVLRDFLLQEKGRWALVTEFGRTSVFRKLTEKPVARGMGWSDQPWNMMDLSMKGRLKRKLRTMMGIGE